MADWQGIALVISSTTALLAVGAPFVLKQWETHYQGKQAKKERIEQHLFFVVDNYSDEWRRTFAWQSKVA